MNYGTQNNIRHNQNRFVSETKSALQTAADVCQLDATAQGHQRGFKGQAKVGALNAAAGAFLKHTFLPKMPVRDFNQAPELNIERDFYKSLSQLAEHYQIELKETQSFGYPYNVSLALCDAKEKLKEVEHWSDLQIILDANSTHLVSTEKFHTHFNLYYVPVQPLYLMLRNRKHRKVAQLLLSVCSYLLHVADIPYFMSEDSYMYYQYEIIVNTIEEIDNSEESEELGYSETFTAELKQVNWVGERIEQVLFNKKTLNALEARLAAFKPKTDFEAECYKLAAQALGLYKDYPKTSIFRNTLNHEDLPGYEGEILLMDRLISFIANDKGPLFDCLWDYINHELNEYAESDEPTIVKRFDSNPIQDINFDFETRIFSLLDNLCGLLNTYQLKK